MGITTKTCEENSLLSQFGRRFTVDMPQEHQGWLAGAQAVAAGGSVVLATARMPLPMSIAFEVVSHNAGTVSFAVVGFDHFGNPRQETVTVTTVADTRSYGMTNFVYDRVTSIQLLTGALAGLGGVGGADDGSDGILDEYVAVGVNYHSPSGPTRLGLPCQVRGLTDIAFITLDGAIVAAPVVATQHFWYVRLPSIPLRAGRLTIHWADHAEFKY